SISTIFPPYYFFFFFFYVYVFSYFFFLMIRPPLRSTLFPYTTLFRSQSGNPDEHDLIFLVCTQEVKKGGHIGRTCLCCTGNSSINDYPCFKESMIKDHYDAIVCLLFSFTYTEVKYKAINE